MNLHENPGTFSAPGTRDAPTPIGSIPRGSRPRSPRLEPGMDTDTG